MTVALVLGSACGVYTDVIGACGLIGGMGDGVVACNDIAAHWTYPLAAVASYHPEKWPYWLQIRARSGFEPPARVFGHSEAKGQWRKLLGFPMEYVDPRFPGQSGCGSSGLFALKVALVDLGYDKAVLCGVPLNDGAHFTEAGGSEFAAADEHRPAWLEALPQIKDRARSMSGWTRELLGAPDKDWLQA